MKPFRRKERPEPRFKRGDPVWLTAFIHAYEGTFIGEAEQSNKYIVKCNIDGKTYIVYKSTVEPRELDT